MLGCAPISDKSKDPEPNPDISFSVTAVASSVQLEVTSIPAVTDAGGLIRLAAEAAPTQTEAQASKGYVSLSIDANSTRKFSLSQHYTTNFDDGITLTDVLAPNTKYTLYLYMPAAIDLGTTKITGGEIKGDRVEISFTTVNLPAAGDTVWSEKLTAKEYVASLNEYHFMQVQMGIVVAYFQLPFTRLLIHETSVQDSVGADIYNTVGSYGPGTGVIPVPQFYYNHGVMDGYTSDYHYFIGADKLDIIKIQFRSASTAAVTGISDVSYLTPISRY
ncbi:hypothetical protein P0082_11140 [Candidatus Haliotispira prima]|uniref:Lipoprotein n=1 Tax=Candidatus Haliotispira prima TaxID=3034016 RepID=A0ABY8MIL8_9SPIO|nr:hypothetical protein P0082_11140 [Candidatus Haliotispira prima]